MSARGRCRLDPQFFRTKSIDQLISDSENPEKRLKKSLGWLSLTALGIGAVIGSGIFTVVGTAIAGQKFEAKSILNAPLLEYLIYHSPSFGRPGAGPAIAALESIRAQARSEEREKSLKLLEKILRSS